MAPRARVPVGVLAVVLLAPLSAIAVAAPASEPTLSPSPAPRASAISAITIDAPAFVSAVEGNGISITARAGSGDPHSILDIQVAGEPPGLTLTQFGFLPRFGTLSGVLGPGTAGTWTLSWTVRDQFGAYDSTATTLVVEESGGTDPSSPLGEGRILIAPTGASAGDQFGVSAAGVGDVNEDGFPDVLVGAWTSDVFSGDEGRAYLYSGGPSMDATADLVLQGAAPGDNFGTTVSSAGDFNGDGHVDLIVGAWGNDAAGLNAGSAYLYFGGPAMDAVADRVFSGEQAGDRFGRQVCGIGDFNADGFSDVAVGAHFNDAAGSDAGRAYIYFGGPVADAVADLVLTGEAAGDEFGWSISGGGDVNGDGFSDLIVGASGNDAIQSGAGRAYVYFGGPAADATADWVLSGDVAGGRFGISVALAGDPNGDGFDDVIVGADHFSPIPDTIGRAYLFHGGPSPDVAPDLTLVGDAEGGGFGFPVSSAGDMNGDGFSDVTVGAWLHPARGPQTGRAYVYFGGPGMDAVPDLTLTGERAGDALGASVAAAGDVDGDGFDEIVVGAYFYDATLGDDGRAYVVGTVHGQGGNAPPTLSGPAVVFGAEGVSIQFTITATDPDDDHVTLGVGVRPVGSVFIDLGNNSGAFSWTPSYTQAGTYGVVFTGQDPAGASAAPLTVAFDIDNVNRAPIAVPGGPYTGLVAVPLNFDGSGSSDPDGDPLVYRWDFGDGTVGNGPSPVHMYLAGGVFAVTLQVSDPELSHSATTTATIQSVFPAAAFLDAANQTTRLQSARPTTCVQIEPVGASYANSSVLISSLTMTSFGTGSVSEIHAVQDKTATGSDRDRDGIGEITACFSKDDLRLLFDGLPGGRNVVLVTLRGDLATGGRFQAALDMEVVASGGGLTASIAPNPLRGSSVITVRSTRAGPVRIQIFDPSGRLVRTLVDHPFSGAGYHDVTVDGNREDGSRLGSGIYFYKVQAGRETATGRFTILN